MMWLTKTAGANQTIISNKTAAPLVPFYSLPARLNDGSVVKLEEFRGKKILLVNTASDCGYTGQYTGLEQLYQEHIEKLVVIGIPANDFKEQEKGSDEEIASFCKRNFGVSFPLLQKATVIRGSGQHEIFQWLTNKNKNGWNDQAPTWNFCKYLVDEQGKLIYFFAPSVEPMSTEMQQAIAE